VAAATTERAEQSSVSTYRHPPPLRVEVNHPHDRTAAIVPSFPRHVVRSEGRKAGCSSNGADLPHCKAEYTLCFFDVVTPTPADKKASEKQSKSIHPPIGSLPACRTRTQVSIAPWDFS
jgi:hypothetical protein